jgi:hypothetical protein
LASHSASLSLCLCLSYVLSLSLSLSLSHTHNLSSCCVCTSIVCSRDSESSYFRRWYWPLELFFFLCKILYLHKILHSFRNCNETWYIGHNV